MTKPINISPRPGPGWARDVATTVNNMVRDVQRQSGAVYIWDTGCLAIPTSTNEAGGAEITFDAPLAGNCTLIITVVGAQGTVNASLNGVALGSMNDPDTINDIRYEFAATNLIEGINSFKIWATGSEIAELRRLEVWRNFAAAQIDTASIDAPTIGVLINSLPDGTASAGDVSLVGFTDAVLTVDTDGFIWLGDTKYTIARDSGIAGGPTIATSQANKSGFIAFDPSQTLFTRTGTATKPFVVFAYLDGNAWKYDDGAAGVGFTPGDGIIAIGWLKTGATDVATASLFSPAPFLSASQPGATFGARLDETFLRADGLTLISETDFVAAWNKIVSSNVTSFMESAAISTLMAAVAYIQTANIVDGSVTNAKIGAAAINNAKIGAVDASVIAETVARKWAAESGATVGAKVGTNFVKADGSTVINEVDLLAVFNKLASSNISLFVDTAAIADAYIADLSAAKITAGTISANLATVGELLINTAGRIRSGQTAFNTGTGFWLGNDAGTPKFSIGNGSTNSLSWNGSTLAVVGDITVQDGSIVTDKIAARNVMELLVATTVSAVAFSGTTDTNITSISFPAGVNNGGKLVMFFTGTFTYSSSETSAPQLWFRVRRLDTSAELGRSTEWTYVRVRNNATDPTSVAMSWGFDPNLSGVTVQIQAFIRGSTSNSGSVQSGATLTVFQIKNDV